MKGNPSLWETEAEWQIQGQSGLRVSSKLAEVAKEETLSKERGKRSVGEESGSRMVYQEWAWAFPTRNEFTSFSLGSDMLLMCFVPHPQARPTGF